MQMHMKEDERKSPGGDNPQAQLNELAADLKKLGQLIALKNNRATHEVKDAIRALVGEVEKTADQLRQGAAALTTLRDEASVRGHLALLEAKDKLALLDDVVKTALAGVTHSSTFLGETARLKLALGRMEVADVFEEKRRLLHEERRRFELQTQKALFDINAHITDLSQSHANTNMNVSK